MLFQSCFSLKQSCFRAVQGCFPLIQRCSALVKVRHILVWNSKNTLINTTFALFSVHFLLKTLYFSLFTILQGTCDQEAWGRGGCVNSNFWLKFRRNDFFHSWYTPKEHVFRYPNIFSNLHEAFSSVSHFVLIQRWTALIQRKPALNSSETALISAGFLNPFWNSADQRWNFWNLWNSAVQRWFALGLQPGRLVLIVFFPVKNLKSIILVPSGAIFSLRPKKNFLLVTVTTPKHLLVTNPARKQCLSIFAMWFLKNTIFFS